MTKDEKIREWLTKNKGYLKKSPTVVLNKLGDKFREKDIREAQRDLRKFKKISVPSIIKTETNVGIVGDLHSPFTREEYLQFCIDTFKTYKVNKIVLIGDIIDNHYSSYHETIPDGKSAGDELSEAIKKLADWIKAFPTADVCIGNHDAIIHRKAITAGLSRRWIKEYNEVLGAPKWHFEMDHEINGVIYTHGTGGSGSKAALNRALNLRQPVVQGHLHTEFGVQYNASKKDLLFGLQVGCGVDDRSYALAYASQNIRKSILGCGVVLQNGRLPLAIPMNL